MAYDNHPAQAAAKERRPPPLWPPLASCGLPAFKRGAPATHKSLGVSVDNQYPAANLRSKNSLIGWAYGGSERTVLRKVDPCEDDGARLRDDFDRLRGVSADPSNLTVDSKKKVGGSRVTLHSTFYADHDGTHRFRRTPIRGVSKLMEKQGGSS